MIDSLFKTSNRLNVSNRWLWSLSLFFIVILIVFWQIPGTIALRNISLALLLISLVLQHIGQSKYSVPNSQSLWKTPGTVLLLVLSTWMLWVIAYRSPVPTVSIAEFRGQWLVPVGCWFGGVLVARSANVYGVDWPRRVVTLIFIGLLFQILLHNFLEIWFWLETGDVPFRAAPVFYLTEIAKSLAESGNIAPAFDWSLADKFSYVNNTCAALLIAEIVQRLLIKKPYIQLKTRWLVLAAIAVLFCSYLLRMRNGNVGLLLLVAMTGLLVLVRTSREWSKLKLLSVSLMFLAGLASFGWVAYKSDARWLAFSESIVLALDDSESNKAWLIEGYPYPSLKDGSKIDTSAYDRLSWGKEGVKLVKTYPFGLGYNRNAFGLGVEQVYHQQPRTLHAHSGLVDFTVANGLPGLCLWLLYLIALAWVGWSAFSAGNVAVGLMLMFLVSSFFGRSIVDSNLRDHILQQFMFLAGFFYTICQVKSQQSGR